jgi:rRNA maturation RNase YbeY
MPVLFRSRLRRKIVREPRLITLAQKILTVSGDPEAELSLEIVGNTRIRRLNLQYRQQDHPTDVLAFPIREAAGPRTPLLGDVVISFPKAAEQASRYGYSIEEELMKLLIHGILHLKGYDHERGELEARRMRRKEREILETLRPLPKLLMEQK